MKLIQLAPGVGRPNYRSPAGADVKIVSVPDDTVVGPRALVLDSLDGFTLLNPPPPPPSQEAVMEALRKKCADHSQKRLDAFAAGLGYDNITTLRAAALSALPRFHAEGVAGQGAWDAEWGAAQTFIAAVLGGQVAPTFDNYKTAMPASFAAPAYA